MRSPGDIVDMILSSAIPFLFFFFLSLFVLFCILLNGVCFKQNILHYDIIFV